MTNWSKLPYEIKLLIGREFFEDCDEDEWQYVNHELHGIYQFISNEGEGKEFNFRDYTKIDNIINSPLQPGKWITRASRLYLKVHKRLDKFDVTLDPLYRFMDSCPNMTSVLSIRDETAEEGESVSMWRYFSKVLLQSNTWRLKQIPRPLFMDLCESLYYQCAYHMKDSLTTLSLAKGMLNHDDLNLLTEFNNLICLNIGKDMLRDIYDCGLITNLLPNLEQLQVEGFINNPPDKTSLINNNSHKSLQSLEINYYTPSTDDELLYMIKTYPCLQELKIYGITPWPSQVIQSPIMKFFLQYISAIKSHDLNIHGLSYELFIIKMYYAVQKPAKTSLLFRGNLATSNYNPQMDYNVQFVKSNTADGHLELEYSDSAEQKPRILELLLNLDESVELLKIHFVADPGDYMEQVMQKPHTNLKILNFRYCGPFSSYIDTEEILLRAQSVKKLVFHNMKIAAQQVLPFLSKDFPHLQRLEFDSCSMATNDRCLDLCMEHTSIEKLVLCRESILTPKIPVLISIALLDSNFTRYYAMTKGNSKINSMAEVELDDIGEKEFERLKASYKRHYVMMSLRLRDLKYLYMETRRHPSNVDSFRRAKITISCSN